jgi:leucyl aminopeptidase
MFESVRLGGPAVPDCLVVAHFQNEQIDKATKEIDPYGTVAAAHERGEATGEPGRIVEVFPHADGKTAKGGRGKAKPQPKRVMLVGLGEKKNFDVNRLRTVAASIGRRLVLTKDSSIRVDLSGPLAAAKADPEQAGIAFGEGLGLLAWNHTQFKGKATTKPQKTKLMVQGASAAFDQGLERGLALAESANFARTLSETPPNIATPAWIAEQAMKLGRKTGMKVTVFRGRQLEQERFTGLINVGKASENEAMMIRIEYQPRGQARGGRGGRSARSRKPVVLIGKTMTYDSGGLSLKINNGMVGMKRDKDGGCGVLGAMHAIGTVIRPRVPVVALLAAAENAISDEAYRPDDILTFRNGVTVEVTNTDAEGRLVLADAYCYACEKENPAYIVELSTLTGGVVVALGSTFAGLWCDDDRLRGKLEAAAKASGEALWRLPLNQDYRDMMKSPVADILNSNPNRKAHPIQGAAFLSYFVQEGIPWAHIDIAGVHEVEGDAGPYVKGPTGFGARLLANLLDAE